MPELPEVETMRRGILEIEGSLVVAAERKQTRQRAEGPARGSAGEARRGRDGEFGSTDF